MEYFICMLAYISLDFGMMHVFWPFIWPHVAGSLGHGFDPPPQYQSVINNGSIPLDTSYDSQLAKYENEMNMRNMHSKYDK